MPRPNEFSLVTQKLALARQKNRCASCGTIIFSLGDAAQTEHEYSEGAHAHHRKHINKGGLATLDNCVILCWSCHYSAHEGGIYHPYRDKNTGIVHGLVVGRKIDFPYFRGS
jgi:5-methylcytosine-specific restriction endonuclease McrA